MNLSSYHTQTQTYWEELSSLQVTVCSIEGLLGERETNHVIDFLMGLNENYDHIKSQNLMKKTFPTLSEVLNIFDQEEFQRTARFSSSPTLEPTSFQVHQNLIMGIRNPSLFVLIVVVLDTLLIDVTRFTVILLV